MTQMIKLSALKGKKFHWWKCEHVEKAWNSILELTNSLCCSYRTVLYIQGADHTYRMLKIAIAIMYTVTSCMEV